MQHVTLVSSQLLIDVVGALSTVSHLELSAGLQGAAKQYPRENFFCSFLSNRLEFQG